MQPVRVECTFEDSGKVRVRRIAGVGQWETVEQGRQWLDDEGRHVLVLVRGSRPVELILQRDTLLWVMKGDASPGVFVV